ncbi:hypothetical protein OFM39_33910, partial [Escherichia coli]|nr:hypothetical protein [Escherichia coli]
MLQSLANEFLRPFCNPIIINRGFSNFDAVFKFHTTFLVVPSSGYSKVSKDLKGINKLFSFSTS